MLDYKRQVALINEMVQLRKDDDKWEAYYHHPSTNEMWKSFFPKANGKKRGPKVMRVEPVPHELAERLDMCLKSDNVDNATGLSLELSVNPGKWDHILEIIEQNYREYDRGQLKVFLNHLGIFEYEQLFDDLGYELEQFDLDKEKLKKLIWRARKIKFKKAIIFW
ncbi:hypothetical protein NC796_00875 [Aliifodinibius sp. S!AR15-10]|uniref:hypothetical protein n=1 Tax=Aliifodinibius sp. S!AR15-10 TaxID=2950437 RepID=UPI0028657A70|nr:hypothetical protein [Aliifodinibius sp. S!AR15-10]MDR8389668.1 hypothetical protein [Aliifodinibius sp. S!AR15-10]